MRKSLKTQHRPQHLPRRLPRRLLAIQGQPQVRLLHILLLVCGVRVSVHELLRPGEEAGDAQRKVSTAAHSDSDGDYSEDDAEEDEEESHSVMTGKAIEVAGLEGEVATVGKPLVLHLQGLCFPGT